MGSSGIAAAFGRRIAVAVFSLVLTSAMRTSIAQIRVPEIPNPMLPDIAMVQLTPSGPVIIYNPNACAAVGPFVCEFFRWHEYGHVMLGHGYVPNWPQVQEFQADCWAGANAPPAAVQAALQFFMNGGGGTPIHGPGPVRAQRIVACRGGN